MGPGTLIADKYRLGKRLGVGSMGEVWAAVHVEMRRDVAIKLILGEDAELRTRLRREARAYGRVEHPNVVQIYDVGETKGGAPFLVMQLLSGETLAARIQRDGALPPREAARIALDIANALQAVHEAGIIHRDLKPANVFLHENPDVGGEQVKVLDFGVSKIRIGEDATNTMTGMLVGSPAYMSPEQANASKALDARSDLWSFGVLLFEMLSGTRPFPSPTIGVIAEILKAPIPSIAELVPGLDRRLVAVVERCLERDLRKRAPTAKAVADALRPIVEPQDSRPSLDPPDTVVTDRSAALPAPHDEETGEDYVPTTVMDRKAMPEELARAVADARAAAEARRAAQHGAPGQHAAPRQHAQHAASGQHAASEPPEEQQRQTAPMGAFHAGKGGLVAGLPFTQRAPGPLPPRPVPPPPPPRPPQSSAPTFGTPPPYGMPPYGTSHASARGARGAAQPKRGGGMVILLGVAAGLITAALVLIAFSLRRDRRAPEPPALSAAPSAASAPEAPAPDLPEPPASASSPIPGPASTMGTLNLDSTPPAKVVLDGKPLGQTPQTGVAVTPGVHQVVFLHPTRGRRSITVKVKRGESASAAVQFD